MKHDTRVLDGTRVGTCDESSSNLCISDAVVVSENVEAERVAISISTTNFNEENSMRGRCIPMNIHDTGTESMRKIGNPEELLSQVSSNGL